MPTRRVTTPDPASTPPKRHRPATTPEARENQLVSLAFDLAERQLRDGTASAQVVTNLLKLGSSREKLEQERIKNETILIQGKLEQMASQQRTEELFAEALSAMRSYRGESDPEEFDDER